VIRYFLRGVRPPNSYNLHHFPTRYLASISESRRDLDALTLSLQELLRRTTHVPDDLDLVFIRRLSFCEPDFRRSVRGYVHLECDSRLLGPEGEWEAGGGTSNISSESRNVGGLSSRRQISTCHAHFPLVSFPLIDNGDEDEDEGSVEKKVIDHIRPVVDVLLSNEDHITYHILTRCDEFDANLPCSSRSPLPECNVERGYE
jgi:hypothetical protein